MIGRDPKRVGRDPKRIALLWVLFGAVVYAQRGAAPAEAPKAAAPIDLTGYWVSIVSEDWRYRMVTPTKGDFQGVPVTADAAKVAEAWDPDADTKAGNQCRSYGAPAIMRVPGRIHVTWADDKTLKLETDAGSQTRTFGFDAATKSERTWQGDSTAEWDLQPSGRGGASNTPRRGSLKVTTSNLKNGYLRKNGVPYSEDAKLTEYFDVVHSRDGRTLLMVLSIVDDPKYLRQPFIVSTQFLKQADAKGWEPTPCSATW
jgi:hypothetical protein